MKRVIIICVLLFTCAQANAQHGSASQQIMLDMRGTLEITQISQQDITDLKARNKTGNAQFVVRSNRKFNISVQRVSHFAHEGQENTSTTSFGKTLSFSITENNTGGNAAAGTQQLTGANQQLIANAAQGTERSFAVNYNAQTAGNIGVVYTATNP